MKNLSFAQALEALKRGDKVKSVNWTFTYLEKRNNQIYICGSQVPWNILTAAVDVDGPWEIVVEKYYSFLDCLDHLTEKQNIRRREWPADWFVQRSRKEGCAILIKGFGKTCLLTDEDYKEKDWHPISK